MAAKNRRVGTAGTTTGKRVEPAIIKKAKFGWHPDFKDVVLVLDVAISEGKGAMLVLNTTEGFDVLVIDKTTVRLVGKPIWVKVENNLVKYVRPWKA